MTTKYNIGDTIEKRREFIKQFEGFPDQVIATAWAYADALTKYGVDVSAEWRTVTAQRDALNRAYFQGRADEAELFTKEFQVILEELQKRYR